MKYIPPIKIPDLAKIMLYLQGEADWHRGGFIAESNNSNSSNYLSLVEYPHAIFEEDRSLLFANQSFYSLIGAPREACIGLSIDAIFSRIMDFKTDPKHPFNKILEFMDQDSNMTCVKVTTKFERGTHKSKNVEIRMSKVIAEDNKNAFILAFEDLTYHHQLEENTRYQKQIAENLKHNAIPLLLSNALTVENKLQARDFNNAGMSVFAISYASLRDEYDGELADGCLLFLKAAQEVSGVFPNIIKLMNEPPSFIYLSIPDENDPLDIRAIQIVHFMNAIINSFNSST
ncbi:hypothetical protein TVAG_008930 [Trichomonas vaginalis G3]|uniref:PAS domain-containing protein n=1 Tax=Trichomonas vaginalis (strain ATCC PRA-98 / G3) TaxID=412133 RepID=A2FGT8_TRIV3|nr:PAS domain domain-containing protein [Trichomonas vaginalis G3]EAX95882.1 hypothetical protein TVAG_008930 [Trichomonas vaginalis G3]KAI5528791.1 PAS domain domain-containing protein [Trichomonas vaginalis G3]|eukprot:XP_001308812.1 hypothetical protein [Trichomonas vaginalis G3]